MRKSNEKVKCVRVCVRTGVCAGGYAGVCGSAWVCTGMHRWVGMDYGCVRVCVWVCVGGVLEM